MVESLKNALRPVKRVCYSFLYLIYDGYRFFRYSGIVSRKSDKDLDYKVIKKYHSLEKSLSFKKRRKGAGWSAAYELLRLIQEKKNIKSIQQKSAVKVLHEFYENSNSGSFVGEEIERFLEDNHRSLDLNVAGGAYVLKSEAVLKGKLESPEAFFNSRYSIRSFKKLNVDKNVLRRALELASKTPSVCNRQSWKIFHLNGPKLIGQALALQNGNRGFSEEVNDLLIIATDLRSFDSEIERFQQWIDGGLYAMSLVYALHSLGVASCFLNLSLPPSKDLKLRKLIKAPGEYSFITMIAIGYPEDEFTVCASARTPCEEYYFNVRDI